MRKLVLRKWLLVLIIGLVVEVVLATIDLPRAFKNAFILPPAAVTVNDHFSIFRFKVEICSSVVIVVSALTELGLGLAKVFFLLKRDVFFRVALTGLCLYNRFLSIVYQNVGLFEIGLLMATVISFLS